MAHYELTIELPLVNGQRAQLREVGRNLIDNAFEAMSRATNGNRILRVRTEVRGRDEIAVSVQDSGPGIEPSQLENVFSAFVSTKPQGARHLPHDYPQPRRSNSRIIRWQEWGTVPIRPASRINGQRHRITLY